MAYSNAGKNAAVDGVAAAGTWISTHSGDPGTTGASEITNGTGTFARKQTTWGAASAGVRTGSQVSIGHAAAAAATHWGVWSLQTGGTFITGGALDAPETFGSAGNLLHTPQLTAA